MSVSWKELREAVKDVMRETQNAQPTETHVDHVCSCPDCLCGVMEKLNKTSDYRCAHCGFPFGNAEFMKKLPACPNCGRKDPEKVER